MASTVLSLPRVRWSPHHSPTVFLEEPERPVVRGKSSLQASHGLPRSDRPIRTVEKNVTIDAHIEFVADRNFDRRLDVKVLSRDLRSGLANFLTNRTGGDLGWIRILKDAAASGLRQLKSGAEYAR